MTLNFLKIFTYTFFVTLQNPNYQTSCNPLDHEILMLESLCESTNKSWNGCPSPNLAGWQSYSDRLSKWYDFISSHKMQIIFISYLRFRLGKHNTNYETLIFLRYGQLLSARACQLRKFMSPFESFQRILAWVMLHKDNPVRSGEIRPYFAQILSLENILKRKQTEFLQICRRSRP